MGYDWEGKEDICYHMYIEEKHSLEEIMDYMKSQMNFAPSKRAFQTQFKRWEFPSKQNPAHRNVPLVDRVRDLWQHNTCQKDMVKVLQQEGFDIKERELMRLRAKHRWLLRVPNGMKSNGTMTPDEASALSEPPEHGHGQTHPRTRAQGQQAHAHPHPHPHPTSSDGTGDASFSDFDPALLDASASADLSTATDDGGSHGAVMAAASAVPLSRPLSPGLSPEEAAKRQARWQVLQQESADRWALRKRRRRTRGWAGLPADPPGPPRFPSETTIDESKAILGLTTAEAYRDIRDRFQAICEEGRFAKKTVAGPERWQAAKDRLVSESVDLQAAFWGSNVQLPQKALALDVLCSDVTKRMRTMESRMTIADAKNALGINPEQSRDVRNAFYQTLKADHFTSKLEAGEGHWKELKAAWIQESELLTAILAPGAADPDHAQKVRAVEVLCRDVMKRLRDDQSKRDPSRKKARTGPGPAVAAAVPTAASPDADPSLSMGPPAHAHAHPHAHSLPHPPPHPHPMHHALPTPRAPRVPQAQMTASMTAPTPTAHPAAVDHADLQIDPSLLLAANDPSLIVEPHHHAHAHAHAHAHHAVPHQHHHPPPHQHHHPQQHQHQHSHPPQPQQPPQSHVHHAAPPAHHHAHSHTHGPQAFAHAFVPSMASSSVSAGGVPGVVGVGTDPYGPRAGSSRNVAQSAAAAAAAAAALPVYFRLSPLSQLQQGTKVWLATLGNISVLELRRLATAKHANALAVRIEGVVRDETGTEVPFPIDEDDELEAYMGHVAGGKATFNVQLMPGYE
ncbi:MAG: hypothetical protein M1826_001416 [Phylliscum demangeonii]|nr:MAG: hypothetical protein M1826_001416 [Phylliscum demangeonii]